MIELQKNQEKTNMLEKSRGREEKSDRAENKLSGFVEQRNYEK